MSDATAPSDGRESVEERSWGVGPYGNVKKCGYGIPHLTAHGTRHAAVGRAAVLGRKNERISGGALEATKKVTHFTNRPPNRLERK